jgi:hypothetical protein
LPKWSTGGTVLGAGACARYREGFMKGARILRPIGACLAAGAAIMGLAGGVVLAGQSAAAAVTAGPGTTVNIVTSTINGVETGFNLHVSMAATPTGGGYWLAGFDGGVFSFGNAHFYGSMGGKPLNKPVVGMAATPTGGGYWLVASDGGIFAFGNAHFYGSMGGQPLNTPIVGMAATPTGGGYWLVASDGGIFAFGNAAYFGSLPGDNVTPTAADFSYTSTGNEWLIYSGIQGMAATPTGGGYWMYGPDGGVYAFGDAGFFGSVPGALGHVPAAPVMSFAATPSGQGYRMVGMDGGVYSFGAAQFYGSLPGDGVPSPLPFITSFASTPNSIIDNVAVSLDMADQIVATPGGGGYWVASLNGGIFAFGDAPYEGSVPGAGATIDSVIQTGG